MQITNIKQQQKFTDRYSIFVDNKYSFSLSELALINAELKIGKELTSVELVNLKSESVFDKAYNRVLNLISRRPRSEWEIRDYLRRKKEPEDIIEKLIRKLSDRRLINDLAFAQAWVENRRLLKSISKRKLQQELRAKRVNDEIINEVLNNDETDEVQVLRDLVAKKREQTRYKEDIKLMQYLSRQGFSYNDIKTAMTKTD